MTEPRNDVEAGELPKEETPATTTEFQHRETSIVQYEELAEEREVRRREALRKIAADARKRQEERRKSGDLARSYGVPSNISPVLYDVAGQSYPLRDEPNCKTCRSPYRADIEKYIAFGHTPGWVAKHLPEEASLSSKNIWDHSRKHLPVEISERVAIRELRAEQIGKSITDGVEMLIDEVTLAQEIMAATVKGMVGGQLQPSISDGLKAAQLVHTFRNEDNTSIDQQAYTASMMRYFQIAQQTMSDEIFADFIEGVKRDPILKALADKASEPMLVNVDEPIADAEVVDESVK